MRQTRLTIAAGVAGALAMVGACASGTGGATSGATPGTTAGASNTGGATGSMPGYAGGSATNAGAAAGGMPSGMMSPPGGSAVGTGQSSGTLTGGLTGQSSGASVIPGNTINNIGSDARIVSAIDVANTDEISAATLARSRASSPRVRAFAQQMIADHGQMQTQDRNLASNPDFISSDSADVTLTMRRMDNAALTQLQNTPSGPAFDALYINQQVDAHKRTLALLKAALDQAKDTRVHSLIAAAIPKVQAHLDEATAIQQQLGT